MRRWQRGMANHEARQPHSQVRKAGLPPLFALDSFQSMNTTQIFLDNSGRIRSGWRFAIFIAVFLLVASFIAGSGFALLYSLGVPLEPETPNFYIANSVLILIPALLVAWLCGKYLERLPFRALGAWFTRGWFRHLVAGI